MAADRSEKPADSASRPQKKPGKPQARKIAPPKGTRDAYPEDALRRRYITQAWRDASIRCGFEEIEGPTFEQAELYAVKSGDGILGELFQAFSGKSPDEVAQVQAEGQAPYALRPEFTPTLARMYAAKAGSLPQPCKWFTAGPYFRAEKPQRGRLREFLQWNCDVIGLPDGDSARQMAEMDAEVIAPIVDLLQTLGIQFIDRQSELLIRFNHRESAANLLIACGVSESHIGDVFELIDRRAKMDGTAFTLEALKHGLDISKFDQFRQAIIEAIFNSSRSDRDDLPSEGQLESMLGFSPTELRVLNSVVSSVGADDLFAWDPHIVRGLAYYTGTVFEVIADGERAVAGGGRYDNLIELFGGPPTPACGFGMGDVVLGNLLDDRSLFPEGAELMDAVSRPPASVRPEAFVLSADESADELVRPLVASLRRGIESAAFQARDDAKPWHADRYADHAEPEAAGVRPLHARHTYKATRNLKKLLADAQKQHARFVAILHSHDRVQLKDLDARADLTPQDVPGMPSDVAEFATDPTSPVYVGRAIARLLG